MFPCNTRAVSDTNVQARRRNSAAPEGKMRKAILVVSAAAALACSGAASAQSLPQPVQAAIDESKKDCGGPAKLEKGFVSIKDINGDQVPDYILDYAHLKCVGMPSSFCGSAGCETQIFVAKPNKSYKSIFDDYVQGIGFVEIAGRPAIKLALHGSSCGRAGSDTCYSTLYWNGRDFKPEQGKSDQPATEKATAAGGDLDVQILEEGGDGQVANCSSNMVAGLKANGDGFLAIRSGPGSQYRQLGELHNGDMVIAFQQRGQWAGVVYGSETPNVRCHSTKTHPLPYKNKGWVNANWLKLVAN
ncbi:hypothetical protein RHSP_12272 [Rhizobium freirei PRF 81]|uniref:SH3b domain-containing protein n=6 Tax=Rhizobium TaxID=379 RepID=N6UY54_9HYPH|nr:bacterial SH3 domain-containing protein [Rhizobium tropici CIAT 899]ENN86565.1 hypothetical protein RHSP_12272 [Rhizobium freirei PRF 81]NEV14405.1 hypothetical protein [Rhizobium tropici]TGE88705.1 hypothetical protein C9417_31045 [Rhizobium sp. SEMIA 4088]